MAPTTNSPTTRTSTTTIVNNSGFATSTNGHNNNNYYSASSHHTHAATRLLLLASAVLVTLSYNAALIHANPVPLPELPQSPDALTKEDTPTVAGHAPANHAAMMSALADKRGPVGYVGNRFSSIGPSYSLSYPQFYADYISEMLRPRKRTLYDSAYYDDNDPFVIKKEMPGVLRFGKRDYSGESASGETRLLGVKKSAVPGVLRFGKRDGDIPGVLRFGKRDGDIPGVLRFGKRGADDIPGVLRFGKRAMEMESSGMPGVLRFGKRGDDMPGVLRFGKRDDIPGVLRFGKRVSGGDIPGVLRFG